jgi:hypothetical protein
MQTTLCRLSTTAFSFYLWQPFMTFHPQTEDMPCCGDRVPPTMVIECMIHIKACLGQCSIPCTVTECDMTDAVFII